MDRKYIDDHHVVARYLADQLSDSEREAFEAYYLEHPEMLKDIESAASLKVGLGRLRDAGRLDALLQPRPIYQRPMFLAAAAVAAVAIGVGLIVVRSPGMQPALVASASALHDWRGSPLPLASTHVILRTRSVAYDAEIDLPEESHAVELRVLPEYEAEPPRYRVALHAIGDDDSLRPVANIEGLTPTQDGFVPVYVNTAKLTPGRYQLTLAGASGTSAAENESLFLLRLRSPEQESKRDGA